MPDSRWGEEEGDLGNAHRRLILDPPCLRNAVFRAACVRERKGELGADVTFLVSPRHIRFAKGNFTPRRYLKFSDSASQHLSLTSKLSSSAAPSLLLQKLSQFHNKRILEPIKEKEGNKARHGAFCLEKKVTANASLQCPPSRTAPLYMIARKQHLPSQ